MEIDSQMDVSSYGLFAKIQPVEFKRVLSNLINNSVEAFGSDGRVTVFASHNNQQIQITIQDNGNGIPPEILKKLGTRGETHGKAGGSGLGLFHARTTIESWAGRLEIASHPAPHPNHGTTVTISLPQAPAPEWFVSELRISPQSIVVILDDDPSIHAIWQERLGSLCLREHGIDIQHFSTPDEIIRFTKEYSMHKTAIYLADYELLGHRKNGLDLIEQLGIGQQSILVTSRFEEKNVAERAAKLRVRLIPKSVAAFVPISIEKPREKLDAILIDDDTLLIHPMWASEAKTKGLRIRLFSSPQEFLSSVNAIDRLTPVYIDVALGPGISGVGKFQERCRIYFLSGLIS